MISLGTLDSLDYEYRGKCGVLKVSKGALVVMKGVKCNSLYIMQGSTITGTSAVGSMEKDIDHTMLWHMKLGHMSERGLIN